MVDAVRAAGVSRLVIVMVGGAGRPEVAPGQALIDQPDVPADVLGEAIAHLDVLAFHRTVGDLDWTYVSPGGDQPGDTDRQLPHRRRPTAV
ncbi:hypothetical protein ACFW2D_23280 [Streptomyces sp. NPDC058914]|uniref:hypothetical protein n=1 Tax=Streptomyces TaxID=1883 RepID=UPI0036C88246